MKPLWGIDLGGTKIEGAVLSSVAPLEVACRLRLPTEAHRGYEHILQQIDRLVDLMAEKSGCPRPEHVGIGTPGTTDPSSGLLKNSNTVVLNGKPLLRDLESTLELGVAAANDANCFALAEAQLGAAQGASTVFGVILGTGVGGGIVVDGQVLVGAQGIAGEWGHNPLDPEGEPCYCGRQGCVETVISGPALERFYASLAGNRLPLAEIAQSNDPHARTTIERLCEGFGRAISQVVNILDPHAVVLGGGVGQIDALYTAGREVLERNVFNNRLETKLLRPALGDSAGVFGAALLVK